MNCDKKQNRHSAALKVVCANLLLGIVMSLTACSNKDDLPKGQSEKIQSEATAIENRNEDKAIELYVNVLRNYISAGKTDFSVSFIDLDDDGPREMVVFFGESHTDGGYLFTIKDGEAIQVAAGDNSFFGQYGGGFTYKEKGNVFAAEYESVAVTQISYRISYYAMENGKAVCKDTIQSITQFDSDESKFYVNDMEVDSEKFYSIEENYGLLEMTTVSYSDGVRVMNEQMDMVYKAYNNTEKSADNHLDDDNLERRVYAGA